MGRTCHRSPGDSRCDGSCQALSDNALLSCFPDKERLRIDDNPLRKKVLSTRVFAHAISNIEFFDCNTLRLHRRYEQVARNRGRATCFSKGTVNGQGALTEVAILLIIKLKDRNTILRREGPLFRE